MPELTFHQQMILAVADKLTLGIVVGISTLVGSRIIERFKTDQSLRAELAKTRLTTISPIWKEYLEIERELRTMVIALFKAKDVALRVREKQLQNQESVDEFSQRDAYIAAGVTNEMIGNTIERLARANETLEAAYFWLGRDLYYVFAKYGSQLKEVTNAVKQETIFSREGTYRYIRVLDSRLDIHRLLKKM